MPGASQAHDDNADHVQEASGKRRRVTPSVLPGLCEGWRAASQEELDELFPNCPPCQFSVGEKVVELPLRAARSMGKDKGVLLNVGCNVTALAWSPKEIEGFRVLAIGVSSRKQPATQVLGNQSPNLAAVQMWRVAAAGNVKASLCLGLLHNCGCTRALQWLPSDCIGLLLAVLGDGSVRMYRIPSCPFTSAGPGAIVFVHVEPVWTALVAPPGATELWDRRICSAAGREDSDGSLLIAGGSDRTVVLLWRLTQELDPSPSSMLSATLHDAPTVWSLAWAAKPNQNIIAAGLSNGTVLLWDRRLPSPIYHLSPIGLVQNPIWGLEWANEVSLVLHQTEANLIDLETLRHTRLRTDLRTTECGEKTICGGCCRLAKGWASAWSDGSVQYREVASAAKCRKAEGYTQTLASWSVSGVSQRAISGDETAPRCPLESSEPVEMSSAHAHGRTSTPARRAHIADLFMRQQTARISALRTWERTDSGVLTLRVRPKKDSPAEVGVAVNLTAVASCGDPGTELLACGSIVGLVSVALHAD